ncbi:hypothetical protein NL676_007420 [Syzygium grande]|nr:hypothetical protein NL676_007420 [Syzygium grande]
MRLLGKREKDISTSPLHTLLPVAPSAIRLKWKISDIKYKILVQCPREESYDTTNPKDHRCGEPRESAAKLPLAPSLQGHPLAAPAR